MLWGDKMLNGLLFGIITAFVLAGIVAVVYYFSLRVLFPKSAGGYFLVVPVGDDSKKTAELLYGIQLRLDLLGDSKCSRIIALDNGLNEVERNACEALCRESAHIYLCKPDGLVALMTQEEHEIE